MTSVQDLELPPLDVKFLIEGEEETGSPHLPGYVRRHARELACDLVISADGAQWRPGEPSLPGSPTPTPTASARD